MHEKLSDRAPGIVPAERDNNESERKRLERAAREVYKREGFKTETLPAEPQ